jgi:hypothetical protein
MTAKKEAQFPRTIQNVLRLSVALPQKVYREFGGTETFLSYIRRLLFDQETFAKHLQSALCQFGTRSRRATVRTGNTTET